MKKKMTLFVFLFFLLFSAPLWAGEELMTKLFFDKWLQSSTLPLESQIKELQTIYATLESESKDFSAQLTTEVKVVIGESRAFIDGQAYTLEAAPVIFNSRTMVPVRFIGEAFGASFLWDDKIRKVTYIYKETLIELFIGQEQAFVNKREIMLDSPPFIEAGRTMVPLRFVSEHMGVTVVWDEETRTVSLRG